MADIPAIVARLAERRAAPLLEARATALAEHMLSLAPELGLEESNDVLEILDLWFSLEERATTTPYVQGLMSKVLSIKNWPLAARIAFLRRHLEGREIVPADNAIANALFGLGESAVT